MKKWKLISGVATVAIAAVVVATMAFIQPKEPVDLTEIEILESKVPLSFGQDKYVEPEFVDSEARTNNAFNVIDFGEQGNNGWFYRYGDANKPQLSKQIEKYGEEKYYQPGFTGMEIKKNFIHTAEEASPILEWRAAQDGNINLKLAYLKNVNADKNPSYPDGVTIYVYKGEELIKAEKVAALRETENIYELELNDISVLRHDSIYFVVDPNSNNAYDGGSLYVAISDKEFTGMPITKDSSRKDNNANSIEDFGTQGSNGWSYMVGNKEKGFKTADISTEEGYQNYTSPNYVISQSFIHPSINDDAAYCWTPARDGAVEIRMNYSKFEQADGNPDYPDGVVVSVYKNKERIFNKEVSAPLKGENKISFRAEKLNLTTKDKLYFVVSANKNASYDGGCFDISILDRLDAKDENSITVESLETRQNIANVKTDFGPQGTNGWFYQEGFEDQPFTAYNMTTFNEEEDRYEDPSFLEIKRDYVNTGAQKRSAVIKWKVAQNGTIKIDAAYTKLKNEDKNPSWPDGTRVTLYHNNTVLVSEDFPADTKKEITKRLDVEKVEVAANDYITMVINGKDNNAYDGGNYEFKIMTTSGLVGETEKTVAAKYNKPITNNADLADDFGAQGNNSIYYQFGYNNDPYFAVNVERYEDNERRYIASDGLEIKNDYIIPGKNGKNANVKWVATKNSTVDVFCTYTKLKNEDKNPAWPDGVKVLLYHNGNLLKSEDFAPLTDQVVTKDLSAKAIKVKAGDAITLVVDGKENSAYDGGNYTFEIEDTVRKTLELKNDSSENQTTLKNDFGEQGSKGWYYAEGKSIKELDYSLSYDSKNNAYYSAKRPNLEIKADFIQPRKRAMAAYQWVVAKDGQIDIEGDYCKFGHQDPNKSFPDGTVIYVYHNDKKLLQEKVDVLQGDGHDVIKDIVFKKLDVKKGDVLSFAVAMNKNNAWDGGRYSLRIHPTPVERDNNKANLFNDFGPQGSNGWYYGSCEWDSKNFAELSFDETNGQYVGNGKPILKKDFVEPGDDKNAAYMWVAAADGLINVKGTYTKFANSQDPEANGTCMRIFVNGVEKKWMGSNVGGNHAEDTQEQFNEKYFVNKGDVIIFAINPEGNDSYDGGKLEVDIAEVEQVEEENRSNNAVLSEDFSSTQGAKGWTYGFCDWNGTGFTELAFNNETNNYDKDNVIIGANWIRPGDGGWRSAAIKWTAAKDGTINVSGSYELEAHEDSDGVSLRMYLPTIEGDNFRRVESGQRVDFNYTISVVAGQEILFAINPEANNAGDGATLSVSIAEVIE